MGSRAGTYAAAAPAARPAIRALQWPQGDVRLLQSFVLANADTLLADLVALAQPPQPSGAPSAVIAANAADHQAPSSKAAGGVQFKIGTRGSGRGARPESAKSSSHSGRGQHAGSSTATPAQSADRASPEALVSAAAKALAEACRLLGLAQNSRDASAFLPRGVGLHEALHPGVVAALASRATHLAGGSPSAALALLGAWVLEGLAQSKSQADSQAISLPSAAYDSSRCMTLQQAADMLVQSS